MLTINNTQTKHMTNTQTNQSLTLTNTQTKHMLTIIDKYSNKTYVNNH